MALRKEELCPDKGLSGPYSHKWAAGGQEEVGRKGVSIHLNKTKQNIKEKKSSSNPGSMGVRKGHPKFQHYKCNGPLKRFFPNAKTLVKCRKGILALMVFQSHFHLYSLRRLKLFGKKQRPKL